MRPLAVFVTAAASSVVSVTAAPAVADVMRPAGWAAILPALAAGGAGVAAALLLTLAVRRQMSLLSPAAVALCVAGVETMCAIVRPGPAGMLPALPLVTVGLLLTAAGMTRLTTDQEDESTETPERNAS